MDENLRERITANDVVAYKREVLEQSVLIAPKEAARILSCSENTVYGLVRNGDLHGYNKKRGTRGLRLLAADLQRYVRSIRIDPEDWRE